MPIKLIEQDEQGQPRLTDEAKVLVPFRNLITRGKRPNLERALKEIAYVYWFARFDTPFDNYSDLDKILKVKQNVGLEEDWKPDALIEAAIVFYKEMQHTKSMDYLEDSEFALRRLSKYLRDADPDERIQSGPHKDALVHDLNKIKNLQKEMPDMIEATQRVKELVNKELNEKTQLRAGRKTNQFTE